MEIKLNNHTFKVINTKEKITIADSFVVRQNKIGQGHGESRLYVGYENKETRDFFGEKDFVIPCFFLKQDLQKYLEETKVEYLKPEQLYVNKDILPLLWTERKVKIDALPEKIEFEISEKADIASRVYVNSDNPAYTLIRELSLPNITFVSIIKLIDEQNHLSYYFRLFADYFGESLHPSTLEQTIEKIEEMEIDVAEKKQLYRARVGHGEYRKKLIELCPRCPITLITDGRLLNASHIKPWVMSNVFEKTDPYNGFILTPTFDRLFDRGFLSFTDDKRTILSPFLSDMTYSTLGISDNKFIPHLPIEGREAYLEYHRTKILKR